LQPARDALIVGVVDDQRLEIRFRVREHREQPALGVWLPAVHDREQGYGARLGLRSLDWPRRDRLQLAARRAVDDVPSAVAEPIANRVRGLEVALATPRDAFFEELLSAYPIRAFWL